MKEYQWYPGHMTKARRMMEENIRLVDLVIELADARIPLSSRNPDIDTLAGNRSRILLLCKADLADPARTQEYIRYYEEKGIKVIALDARTRKANDQIRKAVDQACQAKIERDRKRGIVGRPLRAMVVGVPNVGKSTFINSFAGKASAKTGNKPGVTRGKQWIRLGKNLDLLDTPGILWPKFEDREIGIRLALVSAIRDELLDEEELSMWLAAYLEKEYPGMMAARYAREGETYDPVWTGEERLRAVAVSRNLCLKGGEPDIRRTARTILDDFRSGRLGRITLERLPAGEEEA